MSRMLERGLKGPDVALAQRDLNVWYRYWEAPVSEILDEDGELGVKTELAFRRVRARLGLPHRVEQERVQISPRDRLIVRHLGRLLVAKQQGRTYEVPESVKRTPQEIARGREARDYERR